MSLSAARLLEFEKIIDSISMFAHSPATLPLITALAPLRSKIAAQSRFALLQEIRELSSSGVKLPLGHFEEISRVIELSRPQGSLLSTEELSVLIPFLKVSASINRLFSYRNDTPLLLEATCDISSFPEILEPLEHTIAPDGGILDTASNLLFNLRKNSRHLVGRIRKRLEEIVRERAVAIFLQDDFITQRNGRWVIPVRMDSKGMVPGVVHDVSRSGETAFMEPIEIIGMVNELENLHAEEKAEEIRILKEITGWIREDADAILASFNAVVNLDFLNSIAAFADILNAQAPGLSDGVELEIIGGFHPLLLMLSKERKNAAIVPLELKLGGESGIRTVLITGPNTGGKTIAIKAAGLLMLMAQSGIPVPVDRRSIFPATARLSADIGDEQSIEESLSTFSAHIRKISSILDTADSQTVVLLDELGTGTDPLQGGAIACATLSDLMQKGSVVLATTHLVDIVAYVQKTPGMTNAAMEFDRKSLTPLYRLTMGEPGQSHALDIARRCGLPERILKAAESFAGTMESEFHSLLADLKESINNNERLRNDLAYRDKELLTKEADLEAARKEIEAIRRQAREKGLLEAKTLVNASKAELNRILEEAKKDKSRKSVGMLASIDAKLDSELNEITPQTPVDREALREGANVHVRTLGTNATVIAIDKKNERLRVRAGSIELEVPFSAISPEEVKPQSARNSRASRPGCQAESPYELNLIGKRVDDALLELEKFLDNCAVAGMSEVRIIHGIGTGALMRGVREQLARSPHVESFRAGEGFEGRDGVSVVKIAF
ncbi:MAG: Smr/MutS family protein [Geobacteraceae bacterium]|nr:Smr/MutS family protein [Geobacteraceae bacterium]